jgi:hypothetical protein
VKSLAAVLKIFIQLKLFGEKYFHSAKINSHNARLRIFLSSPAFFNETAAATKKHFLNNRKRVMAPILIYANV